MHFAGFLRVPEHLVYHFWRGRSTRGPVRFGVVGGSVGAKGGGRVGGWEAKSLNAIISVTRSRMTFELRQLMGHDVGHLPGEKLSATLTVFGEGAKIYFKEVANFGQSAK
jgi:hypothetical protein